MKSYFHTIIRLAMIVFCILIVSISCTSIQPKVFSISDLEGKWAGEWMSGSYSGKVQVNIQRAEPLVWKWEIFAEELPIPGNTLTLTLKEESPQKLSGEFMGGKAIIQLTSDKKIDFNINYPMMGEIKAGLSCYGNITRGSFSLTSSKYTENGTVTLEKIK